MDGFLSDTLVVERIFAHIDRNSTDKCETVWREPVENYLSEERLKLEHERILRSNPTVFCPSAALPDVGSYVARRAAGVPLVAVRGHDGKVRAFRNACRHRGAEIAAQGTGCTRAFVCPYHGWSYRLDGKLQSVPHKDGFPDVNANTHSLSEVEAQEFSGLIFIQQENQASVFDTCDGMASLISPEQTIIRTKETVIEANWKAHLESFIEGYHIKSTHPESFFPFGYDNLNVIEHVGRNSRVTFPFQRIEKLRHIPKSNWDVKGRLTYVYHLYPNVIIAVLTHHTSIVILEPQGPATTKMITYAMTNSGSNPNAFEDAERDLEFVGDTGAKEDQAIVQSIQRGLNSKANEFLTFGHYEPAIQHFHRNLAAQISD